MAADSCLSMNYYMAIDIVEYLCLSNLCVVNTAHLNAQREVQSVLS